MTPRVVHQMGTLTATGVMVGKAGIEDWCRGPRNRYWQTVKTYTCQGKGETRECGQEVSPPIHVVMTE